MLLFNDTYGRKMVVALSVNNGGQSFLGPCWLGNSPNDEGHASFFRVTSGKFECFGIATPNISAGVHIARLAYM